MFVEEQGIALRLREIRLAMKLNQTEFGALGGVKKRAQIYFEQGVNEPGAPYWQALSKAGVDVLYILTGVRAALSAEEAALLDNYRAADDAGKKRIRQASAAQPEPLVTGRRARGAAAS